MLPPPPPPPPPPPQTTSRLLDGLPREVLNGITDYLEDVHRRCRSPVQAVEQLLFALGYVLAHALGHPRPFWHELDDAVSRYSDSEPSIVYFRHDLNVPFSRCQTDPVRPIPLPAPKFRHGVGVFFPPPRLQVIGGDGCCLSQLPRLPHVRDFLLLFAHMGVMCAMNVIWALSMFFGYRTPLCRDAQLASHLSGEQSCDGASRAIMGWCSNRR
ncbi:hypothetical protein PG988_014631 [Apiospora saccharicola]